MTRIIILLLSILFSFSSFSEWPEEFDVAAERASLLQVKKKTKLVETVIYKRPDGNNLTVQFEAKLSYKFSFSDYKGKIRIAINSVQLEIDKVGSIKSVEIKWQKGDIKLTDSKALITNILEGQGGGKAVVNIPVENISSDFWPQAGNTLSDLERVSGKIKLIGVNKEQYTLTTFENIFEEMAPWKAIENYYVDYISKLAPYQLSGEYFRFISHGPYSNKFFNKIGKLFLEEIFSRTDFFVGFLLQLTEYLETTGRPIPKSLVKTDKFFEILLDYAKNIQSEAPTRINRFILAYVNTPKQYYSTEAASKFLKLFLPEYKNEKYKKTILLAINHYFYAGKGFNTIIHIEHLEKYKTNLRELYMILSSNPAVVIEGTDLHDNYLFHIGEYLSGDSFKNNFFPSRPVSIGSRLRYSCNSIFAKLVLKIK